MLGYTCLNDNKIQNPENWDRNIPWFVTIRHHIKPRKPPKDQVSEGASFFMQAGFREVIENNITFVVVNNIRLCWLSGLSFDSWKIRSRYTL